MVVKPGTPPQTTPMELVLGSSADEPISLDIDVLLWTNLLVQAAPGAGKSWVLRRLAEEAWGRVPFIVIDPEGEFASLREVAGYVLVGPGGEAPAHVQSAGEVARRLLKLRASAVCDIFELDVEERHQWVREFLRALDISAKRAHRPDRSRRRPGARRTIDACPAARARAVLPRAARARARALPRARARFALALWREAELAPSDCHRTCAFDASTPGQRARV